jgi:hypothetical protein
MHLVNRTSRTSRTSRGSGIQGSSWVDIAPNQSLRVAATRSLRSCTPAAMKDALITMMTMSEGGRLVPGSAATYQDMTIRG